jgi:hypothetical protein
MMHYLSDSIHRILGTCPMATMSGTRTTTRG